jgi:hypothetical protein
MAKRIWPGLYSLRFLAFWILPGKSEKKRKSVKGKSVKNVEIMWEEVLQTQNHVIPFST